MVGVAVADAATTRALRRAVLRPDHPAHAPMPGDSDDAIHLAAWDGTELVGAVALLPRPFPPRPEVSNALQLRGMAVAPDRRGAGIGALVFAAALGIADSRGDELIWCNARTSAVGFYERLGLRTEGAEFTFSETGIAHYLMWRTARRGLAE